MVLIKDKREREMATRLEAIQLARGLSLSNRIRLCVALLEPDCVSRKSALYQAVALLKGLCEY